MKIALDYDDTFTKDRLFWSHFLDACHSNHDEVRIVTMRGPSMGDEYKINDKGWLGNIEIIYTDGKAKREFCRTKGFEPDIWIDDRPELIHIDWEEYSRLPKVPA